MTTLYHSAAPVKSARPARRFGSGILATHPAHTSGHTAADDAWLAADNARRESADRRYDRLAAESAALGRHEAGLCC